MLVTSDLIADFSKQMPERLRGTMMKVDLLSLGVAMVPHNERTGIQIERVMAKAHPCTRPFLRPVWTSYAFALGYEDPRRLSRISHACL